MANTKTTETVIPASLIATGEYSINTIFPTTTTQYPRNDFGTAIVDANQANIDNNRLVVNLIGQRYIKSRFETIISVDFEEFLDPEPAEFEELTGAAVADLSAELASKNSQLDTANKKIEDLLNTNQQLQNELGNINTISSTDTTNQVNEALAALSVQNQQDNTKGRILSDGMMLRDLNDRQFMYIMEDGKKRWLIFQGDAQQQETALAAAKAFGKIKPNTSGRDVNDINWIEVPQYILDRIPTGADFYPEDLVKNKKTPAPPRLELPNGADIAGEWVLLDGQTNPIIIKTSDFGEQKNLPTILARVRFTSAEGNVNDVEVWDESISYYPQKSPLPIRRSDFPESLTQRSQYLGDFGPGTTETLIIYLKDTTGPITSNNNDTGTSYIKRFKNIHLDGNNLVKEFKLSAKIFDDARNEIMTEPLIVRVELVPKPMPNLVGKPVNTQAQKQTLEENLRVNYAIRNIVEYAPGIIEPQSNTDKAGEVYSQSVPVGKTLDFGSPDIIQLQYYTSKFKKLPLPKNLKVYKKLLRELGFKNITVDYILSTFNGEHYEILNVEHRSTIRINPNVENAYNITQFNQNDLMSLSKYDIYTTDIKLLITVKGTKFTEIQPNKTYNQLFDDGQVGRKLIKEEINREF